MADGISNISNTEQLVVCTRWIDDDLNSQEEFIELHLSEITNDGITAKMIKDILLHMNIFLSKFTAKFHFLFNNERSKSQSCKTDQGY